MRAFTMPEDTDAEKIDARFDNGMLDIKIARVPSKKGPTSKTIQVK
jgi:HSP20 family molecular chaperone IbpA